MNTLAILFALCSLVAAALADLPTFRDIYLDKAVPGHVAKIAHCWDGSIYVAGITTYDFEEEEETDTEHIFVGKFQGNQFYFVKTILNTGAHTPQIYDLVAMDSGFILIATYSGTVTISASYDDVLSLEITEQEISVMVASLDDYGDAYWLDGVGLDWKEQYGPFSLTAARNIDDQIFLIGNYFRRLQLGDQRLPSEVGAQTFIIGFDSNGGDVSVNFALHDWNDECEKEPCLHGGICEVNYEDEGYFCECEPGYSGKNCEHVDRDEETKEQNHIGMDREKEEWEEDEDWNAEYLEEIKDYDEEEQEELEDLKEEEMQYDAMEEEEEQEEEEPEEDYEGARRRKRDLKNPKLESRTAFTHTRTAVNEEDDSALLFATGYSLDTTSTYSAFISMYTLSDMDIDVEWELPFVTGKKSLFPSLQVFEYQEHTFSVFVGTFDRNTTIGGHNLTLTEPRAVYVLLANKKGKVLWAHAIEGLGEFKGYSDLKISVAVNCSTSCEILVAAPSTNRTHIGDVKITPTISHHYFLASISFQGQANWIKELFETAEKAELGGVEALNGDIYVVGSVKGTGLVFDSQSLSDFPVKTAFIAKIGWDDDGWQLYERLVAPVVYQEKHHPRLVFLFLTTGAVLFFIYSLYSRQRRRRF